MRRWLVRLALALAGLLVLVAGGLWFARVEILTQVATRVLERQGLGPVRLAVRSVGFDALHLDSLSLGGQAIEASEIIVTYDPLELYEGHIAQVEINGLVGTVTLGDTGIELNGRPFPPATAGDIATVPGAPLGGLRIDSFALRDARLSVLRPDDGPIEATVSTTLTLADGVVQGTGFAADFAITVGGQRQAATIAVAQVGLTLQADGGLHVTLAQGAITPADLPWAIQSLGADFIWQSGKASLQLTSGQLVSLQQPALVVPLQFTGEVAMAGPLLDFTLGVESQIESGVKVQIKGQHDQAANSGSATVTMAPITFKRGGRQPASLSPALGAGAPPLEGAVAVDGTVRWAKNVLSPNLTLRLKNLAFAAQGAQVSALNGNLRFTKLWPPVTAADQALSATVQSGGETAQLKLAGQLTAKPALRLSKLEVGAAGGTISASPFMVDTGKAKIETVLTVTGVELAEITRIIGIGGLSGTGQLDGTIPLTLADGKVAIAGGKLTARGPGLLSFRPDNLPPQIAQAGDDVDLMLRVLGGFHYERLSLGLDKGINGEGTVLLTLAGRNPDVAADQPYNFNIKIDSNFDRLAEYALLSLTSAQELLDRAARSAGR